MHFYFDEISDLSRFKQEKKYLVLTEMDDAMLNEGPLLHWRDEL